jgi:hypothetical protein
VTREEIAGWLCRHVQRARLERIGEKPPESDGNPLDGLPEDERRNWLDMADAVLAFNSESHPVDRLRELSNDWLRYTLQLSDPEHRDEMRRAVVIEMRVEVDRLAKECGL